MKHHLLRLHRWTWYALTLLLLLLALVFAGARSWAPYLQIYRYELANAVGRVLHQPVSIGSMQTRFDGMRPYLQLSDVELLDDDRRAVATLREMHLTVDLLASLRHWRWTLHDLTLIGAQLHLSLEQGALRIHGLQLAEEGPEPSNAEPQSLQASAYRLGDWLLGQGRLSILDSELQLQWEHGVKRLQVGAISLQRTRDGHWLEGRVGLADEAQLLRLEMRVTGDPLDEPDWQAQFHAEAEALRPAAWLPDGVAGIVPEQGSFNAELWGEWRGPALERLSARVTAAELQLQGNEHTLFVSDLALLGRWQRGEEGWQLELADLSLRQGELIWPSADYLLRRTNTGWQFLAEQLPLEPLRAALLLSPDLPAELHEALQGLDPRGRLGALRVDLPEHGSPRLQAQLHAVGIAAWQKLPALAGLSGTLLATGKGGELRLDSTDGYVDFTPLFRTPLEFTQLSGLFVLARQHDGWRLRSDTVEVANTDVHGRVRLDLDLPDHDVPYLDLYGEFADGDARATHRYLPAAIMPPESVVWLDEAFRAGRVREGGVLFHGPLDEFPFTRNQGRFEVRFAAEQVQLHYQPGWPDLHEVDGEVAFIDAGMHIVAERARLYDSPVERTEVSIADLSLGRLQIRGEARPAAADLLRLLRESPLEAHVGRYLEGLSLQGDSHLSLQLHIPLDETLEHAHPLSVRGEVTLEQASVSVGESLTLERADGVLGFSEQGVEARSIKGRLFGEAAEVSIHSLSEPRPHTLIRIDGQAHGPRLAQVFGVGPLAQLHGPIGWHAEVMVDPDPQHGSSLEVSSELRGVSVALPAPLAKPAAEARPLRVGLALSGPNEGRLSLSYAEALQGLLQLDQAGGVERGTLHFGATPVTQLPQHPQLRITGSLSGLDRAPLQSLAAAGSEPDTGKGGSALPPLSVHLEHLRLLSAEAGEGASSVTGDASPPSLPPTDIRIDVLELDELELGHFELVLRPEGNRMQLEELRLEADDYRLHGRGDWDLVQAGRTRVELSGECENIRQLFDRFGIASVIGSGVGVVSGRLQWPGSPREFTLAGVEGSLELSIEQGRIEAVDPGPGRLLGIFSIAALPRRLALDFSDVFGKGFGFDRIGGTLHLSGGNVYTDDLQMEGVAATILVTGRSGLVVQDFDQLVSVVPHISNTLPVAGGLAWGLQVGAALLILKEVLLDDIDSAVMTQYRLRGSWEQPEITRLEQNVPLGSLPE